MSNLRNKQKECFELNKYSILLRSFLCKSEKGMASSGKNNRLLLFALTGIVSVLITQAIWLHNTYRFTGRRLMNEAKEAFAPAYFKEQTYRVPFTNIVNSGAVTIESCGTEEVQIIRFCPQPDTIVYNNLSGLSIESFINRVFVDLREQINPINIDCLADLYSGMLFEKDIPAHFIVERFDRTTGKIHDSSRLPDKKQPAASPETTIVMDISNTESLRAVLQIPPGVILRRMTDTIACSLVLTIVIIACLIALYAKQRKEVTTLFDNNFSRTFTIGQYTFNPAKNELHGLGETIQLNKKENAILSMLCSKYGLVVERNELLEANWGSNGIIYSRSLDTYITALRKLLRKDPSLQIVSIKGVGYKLMSIHLPL